MATFIDSMANDPRASIPGTSNGAALAAAANNAYKVNQLTNSIKLKSDVKQLSKPIPDDWRATQLDPSTENHIPVVYGRAFIGGFITDAYLTNGNMRMWYCLTLCEKTGPLLSTYNPGNNTMTDSEIIFENMFWNGNQVAFKSDGVTVNSWTDPSGNVDGKPEDLVKVYLYKNGSKQPTKFDRAQITPTVYAYNRFPGWTSAHTMDQLAFAIISVDYNYARNMTGIGDIQFQIRNSMTKPGDVLYDYMTNSLYGCGIPADGIYSR